MTARVPVFDRAICVRHWDWSETSQTVTLLTRTHGLVRAVAKGARRNNAPFSGGVELLSLANAGLIIKQARGHADAPMAILTEWDLLNPHPWLRRRLRAYHAGLYVAEIVQHLVSDHDPHPVLFDALEHALAGLEVEGDEDRVLLRYQRTALQEAGYWPVLDRDVRTGAPITAGPKGAVDFVPEIGGVVRPGTDCRTPEGRAPDRWAVRMTTLTAILSGENTPVSPTDLARASRLLAWYIRHLIGREPSTFSAVFGE